MSISGPSYYSKFLQAPPPTGNGPQAAKTETSDDSAGNNQPETKKKRDLQPPTYPPNMPGKSGDGTYQSFIPIFPSAAMVGGNTVFNNNPIDLLNLNFGNDLEGWKEAGLKGTLLKMTSMILPSLGLGGAGMAQGEGDPYENLKKQRAKSLNILA
jgi:hypothetical protein